MNTGEVLTRCICDNFQIDWDFFVYYDRMDDVYIFFLSRKIVEMKKVLSKMHVKMKKVL